MPSTYTTRGRLEKQADGENDTTWGDKLNVVLDLLDEWRGGYLSKSVAGAVDVTLSTLDGVSDEVRQQVIELTGAITANINVIVPARENVWIIKNSTTGSFTLTVKTAAGTGIIVKPTSYAILYSDGTNVYSVAQAADFLAVANNLSDVASVTTARANLGLGTMATQAASAVAITGGTITGITPLSLAVGGTTGTDAASARTGLGLGTVATLAATAVAQTANNLSDLANAATARTNLGLGTAATLASTAVAQTANNLSDLANAGTARTNLGLGSAATLSVGTSSNNVVQLDASAKLPAVDGSALTHLLPAGTILDFGGTAAPTGFLACDGSAVSRTTYATLYAALGTTWGAGDGTTTFNVPNLARRNTVGSGGSSSGVLGNTVGSTGGTETKTIAQANIPSYNLTVTDPGHLHKIYGASPGQDATGIAAGSSLVNQNSGLTDNSSSSTTGITVSSGGSGTAMDIMPPAAVVLKIIKT